MSSEFDLDLSGMPRVDANLGKVSAASVPAARKIVARGAVQIKKDAQRRIGGHPHAPAYPASIGYDEYAYPGVVAARIGPDKERRQGALGNILELGTVNNPPVPHLRPAAAAEEPKFAAAAQDMAAQLLQEKL